MAAAPSHHPPGIFTITKAKVFLAVSLAFTWWIAHIFPHYKPMIRAEFNSRVAEARQKYIPKIKVDWNPTDDPRAAYNASKIALMIEPRPLPHLVPQILHMINTVPPDWRFVFIGTEKSVVSVGRAFATKHQQVIGKMDLMVLPEPWEIESKEAVYRLLTDLRFYDEFLPGVEWILKYEHDSILCSNSAVSLNDWLEWSWAGAPRSLDDRFSGNGGLSMRRVSAIRRVLAFQQRYNDTENEDEWFGKRMWVLPGAKVAAGTEGVLAVEDVYIEEPMGYHIRDGGQSLHPDVWKDPNLRKKIFNYCPELSLIMDMKLERERCDGDDKEGEIHPTEAERERERERLEAEEARRKKLQEEEEEARLKEEEEKKKAEEATQTGSESTATATGEATPDPTTAKSEADEDRKEDPIKSTPTSSEDNESQSLEDEEEGNSLHGTEKPDEEEDDEKKKPAKEQ